MKSNLRFASVVVGVTLLLYSREGSSASDAAEPATGSPSTLQHVLQAEADGKAVHRERLPQDSNANRWAAGNLKVNKSWINMRDLDGQVTAPNSYLEQRQASDDSEQAQLKLARWCTRQGLDLQAAAHYFGVLAANPNNLEARGALKHQWINDRWFTAKEIEQARALARQNAEDIEAWAPKLTDLLRKLQSSKGAQQLAAIEALESIDDPSAIAAMQAAIGVVNEPLALPLVKALGKFRSSEACQALLVVATRDPASAVSQAAVSQLADFPEAMVVPQLLNSLCLPVDMSYNVVGLPNGKLTLTAVVSRELKDRRLVERFENQCRVLSEVMGTRVEIRNAPFEPAGDGQPTPLVLRYVPEVVFAAEHADLTDRGEELKRQVAAQNRRIQEHTHRVCSVLRVRTSQNYGDDPAAWWTWWSERNEKMYPQSKPLVQRNYYDQQQVTLATPRNVFIYAVQHSCLVAGTPVQTASGLRPIEQIQVGDLVPAQDIETGELALKPVIRTTQSPALSIVGITTSAGKIQATGSHYWWVAGQGWKRSRELQRGMQLHTASGTVEVQELADEADLQPVYNLVVDDFHTYFVGPERVLSYDVTPLEGSTRLVPGFDQLAAER